MRTSTNEQSFQLPLPFGFHDFAASMISSHSLRPNFKEKDLQTAFNRFLSVSVWRELNIDENRIHRGDLSLSFGSGASQPHFVVELKRARRLTSLHYAQTSGYAATNHCPCLLTNGIKYVLFAASTRKSSIPFANRITKITTSQQLTIELGDFGTEPFDSALQLNRTLVAIFEAAGTGQKQLTSLLLSLSSQTKERLGMLFASSDKLRSQGELKFQMSRRAMLLDLGIDTQR